MRGGGARKRGYTLGRIHWFSNTVTYMSCDMLMTSYQILSNLEDYQNVCSSAEIRSLDAGVEGSSNPRQLQHTVFKTGGTDY